ncbi:MAG: hypothetical protein N3A61_02360 [Ignavibacteria bacterium]|nr:hypothetical protein [Ignavibacteria bacterium]
MNCDKYKPLILDYFEKSISDVDLKLLLEHLDECPMCKDDLIEIESVTALLKKDNEQFLKEKYFYFQNLTPNKIVSKRPRKKFIKFVPQKAFVLTAVVFFLTFALVNSVFIHSSEPNEVSLSQVELQGLDLSEVSPSLFNGELIYNISTDRLLNSNYFKNEIEILNTLDDGFLPTLQKYFELDNTLIEMNSKDVDNILEQLKNKSFI